MRHPFFASAAQEQRAESIAKQRMEAEAFVNRPRVADVAKRILVSLN